MINEYGEMVVKDRRAGETMREVETLRGVSECNAGAPPDARFGRFSALDQNVELMLWLDRNTSTFWPMLLMLP